MRKLITLLLVVVAIASCKKEVSDNVDQDKIFTIYDLYYNENTDLTTAIAEFRFNNINGTRLELSEPSNVTVNSQDMVWSEETGNYTTEFTGLVPTAEFVWVDTDGNQFANTTEIRDIDYPTILPTYTFADSVNYFMWEGTPLDSFEIAYLEFVSAEVSDQRRRFQQVDTIGATTITIDSVRLSQIDSGLVNTVLVKIYRPELIEATSKGGQISGRYQPTDRVFNLQ